MSRPGTNIDTTSDAAPRATVSTPIAEEKDHKDIPIEGLTSDELRGKLEVAIREAFAFPWCDDDEKENEITGYKLTRLISKREVEQKLKKSTINGILDASAIIELLNSAHQLMRDADSLKRFNTMAAKYRRDIVKTRSQYASDPHNYSRLTQDLSAHDEAVKKHATAATDFQPFLDKVLKYDAAYKKALLVKPATPVVVSSDSRSTLERSSVTLIDVSSSSATPTVSQQTQPTVSEPSTESTRVETRRGDAKAEVRSESHKATGLGSLSDGSTSSSPVVETPKATLPGSHGTWGPGLASSHTSTQPETTPPQNESKITARFELDSTFQIDMDDIPDYIERVMAEEKEHYPVRVRVETSKIILSVSNTERVGDAGKDYVVKLLTKLGMPTTSSESSPRTAYGSKILKRYDFALDRETFVRKLSPYKGQTSTLKHAPK